MGLTKKIVLDAQALIDTEDKWTTGSPVRSIDGKFCYCLGGALAKVISGDADDLYNPPRESPELCNILREFVELAEIGPAPIDDEAFPGELREPEEAACDTIWVFNDSSVYEDVIKVLDHVIAKLPE